MAFKARMIALAGALAIAPGDLRACGLELILAIDVSGSVDEKEFDIQAGGLAAAFETDAVAAAIAAVPGGLLATVTHWSGVSRQRQMVGWYRLTDRASLASFASEIRATPRAWRNFSTAIGEALLHAREIGTEAPDTCDRRVIDVSGDGVSNEGRRPRAIGEAIAAEGYTINGLVIRGADPDPVAEYEGNVIAGPGAFVEIADTFDEYPAAILKKLLREIDEPMIVSDRRD